MQTQFSRRTHVNIYWTLCVVELHLGDVSFMSKIFHSQRSMLPIPAAVRFPLNRQDKFLICPYVPTVQNHLFQIEDAADIFMDSRFSSGLLSPWNLSSISHCSTQFLRSIWFATTYPLSFTDTSCRRFWIPDSWLAHRTYRFLTMRIPSFLQGWHSLELSKHTDPSTIYCGHSYTFYTHTFLWMSVQ